MCNVVSRNPISTRIRVNGAAEVKDDPGWKVGRCGGWWLDGLIRGKQRRPRSRQRLGDRGSMHPSYIGTW